MAEMQPADVPEEFIRAYEAQGYYCHPDGLAAVLPLHEQQVRERIALSLERVSNQQDQDAERHADERSPLLRAQAEALWDAALAVRSGDEDGSEEAGDSVIAKLSEGVVTVPPGTPIPDELLIAMNGGGRVERGGQEAAHG